MPTFANNTLITIPDIGNASPYPSGINVQGLTGNIEQVRVKINLTHSFPDDLDILLAGPGGQNVILMSDAGGNADLNSTLLFFEQSAVAILPDDSQIVSGGYLPTNYVGGDTFPGVAGSISSSLGVFNNTNPNGVWKLYVLDDLVGDAGRITSWRLDLDTNVSTRGNLIQNGSFEIGTNPNSSDGLIIDLNPGSTAIANWNVTRNNIDYIDEVWDASEGFRSLDLNGSAAGGISQTFNTTPGQKYKVSFDLAGNFGLGFPIKQLRVTAAGQFADFSFNTAGATVDDMRWTGKTWQFTANSNSTTLEFLSLSTEPENRFAGPALDNVAVVKSVTSLLPRLSINSLSVFEKNNRNNVALTVTLTGPTSQRVSVNFATANGSATEGRDYVRTTGNVAFNPSNAARQTKTIQIPILGDSLFESNETFRVNLANAVNATLGTSGGTVTLKNDDNPTFRNSVMELSAFSSLEMTSLGKSTSSIIDINKSANSSAEMWAEWAVSDTIL
jgi:choice-of-anchor C domain-containing protein